MNKAERRYRRLLACYPRDHRERNGEEMLGVLLADADDRRGPSWRDTADLLWGAVRLHLRRLVAIDGGLDPRDVLAILSLLGPLAILGGASSELHELGFWSQGGGGDVPWTHAAPNAPLWGIWLLVAVLAVAGLRRVAAVGAWFGTAGFAVAAVMMLQDSWSMRWWSGPDEGWVLLGLLTAVALTWSPGPKRGRELAGRWAVPVLAAAVVLTGLTAYLTGLDATLYFGDPVGQAILLGPSAIVAVAAAGLRSRAGRRAGLLLLLPIMTLLPVVLFRLGLIPAAVRTLEVGDVSTVVEAAVFGSGPVIVVLLALGVLPLLFRRRANA